MNPYIFSLAIGKYTGFLSLASGRTNTESCSFITLRINPVPHPASGEVVGLIHIRLTKFF